MKIVINLRKDFLSYFTKMNANFSTAASISSEWLRFHDAELVVGSFSLIINATLLYIICFKTPPDLKDYRSFIFAITVIKIFKVFSKSIILSLPIFHSTFL